MKRTLRTILLITILIAGSMGIPVLSEQNAPITSTFDLVDSGIVLDENYEIQWQKNYGTDLNLYTHQNMAVG